jgi:hypothetical protein
MTSGQCVDRISVAILSLKPEKALTADVVSLHCHIFAAYSLEFKSNQFKGIYAVVSNLVSSNLARWLCRLRAFADNCFCSERNNYIP